MKILLAALFAVVIASTSIGAKAASSPAARDPYKSYKFRLRLNGKYVAGISKVSTLKRTTEIANYRAGGDPGSSRKSPGSTAWGLITLERGLTQDHDFANWLNGTKQPSSTKASTVRRDIVLDTFNEAGRKTGSLSAYRCWVATSKTLPTLKGGPSAVAIEHITLECDRWLRP